MRLRYIRPAADYGFAICRAGHDDYDKSVLPSGYPAGTPQEALDYRLHDPPHRVAQPRTRVMTRSQPRRTYGVSHLAEGVPLR